LRTFEGLADPVSSVAFSPDGTRVLSGGEDGAIRIWKVSTGELLGTLFGSANGESLILTPEGFFDGSARGTAMRTARTCRGCYDAGVSVLANRRSKALAGAPASSG
jgi:WD40 repeat protein